MIKVIEAGGDARDMGRAIGKAVAQSVHSTVLAHDEVTEAAKMYRGSEYLRALRDAAEAAYPRYTAEIDAIAEGAEVDPEMLFLWNCRGDLRLPPDVAQARLNALADGCTTVLAPGDFDQDMPAVIAHNEDGSGPFMDHRYWLKAEPDEGPAFESFLYPGMLPGHSVAVTATGLVQTINNIRPDDLKPGIPRHVICRAVLGSESLMDAIGHLRRDDRASGFHHSIAVAGNPQPLSVEAPASGAVIRPVQSPVAHANHLVDPYFDKLDQVVTDSSRYRQTRVDDFLEQGGDPAEPEAILFERSDDGAETVLRRPGDGGDDYGCTLATAVFRIHPDRIEWSVHASPDDRDTLGGSIADV